MIANLLAASLFVSFLFMPQTAYSQKKPVPINGNVGSNITVKKPVRKTIVKTADPKVKFDKETYTLNYDDWQYQFVLVEGSKFKMGSEPGDPDKSADGSKAHTVNLDTYAIGNIEVPRWLWKTVMGNDPFTPGIIVERDEMGAPVNNVSWNDCQEFIKKLNSITNMNFALPTEAQWEFAARGGVKPDNTPYSGTSDVNLLPNTPNSLGIYSMSGLYKEWCIDDFVPWNDDTFDPRVSIKNPRCSDNSGVKVVRGGSNNDYEYMKVTTRDNCKPTEKNGEIGFRLVLQIVK